MSVWADIHRRSSGLQRRRENRDDIKGYWKILTKKQRDMLKMTALKKDWNKYWALKKTFLEKQEKNERLGGHT